MSAVGSAGALSLLPSAQAEAQNAAAGGPPLLPPYARMPQYQTVKQSTWDRSGGNADARKIAPGASLTVYEDQGPGIITHIWFTIAAPGIRHLKDIVLRIYWDGNSKPSVETPVGDFFGLALGDYFTYQSAFLTCSSVKALNSYFAMPYRHSAKITIENQGSRGVDAFYSNIDARKVKSLPDDALYFHAQYRQATPNKTSGAGDKNLDGKDNYVFLDTKGAGAVMGVSLGVVQNSDAWFGEGDEMIFIDDMSKPAITGTGTEDYFCGAWDFGVSQPFSFLYNGAPYISTGERAGGRYCLYRWHADNPIAFSNAVKFTIEHGHANDRADCFYSVAYWYAKEPAADFPALPPTAERFPALKTS